MTGMSLSFSGLGRLCGWPKDKSQACDFYEDELSNQYFKSENGADKDLMTHKLLKSLPR